MGKLTNLQHHVTQECGTEPAFDNEYWDNHEEGIYVDISSGEVLFVSKDKFDSGTGWPSFDTALPGAVKYVSDDSHGIKRTEVVCAKCGSHLGHVFDDGPTQTRKRYCINSISLNYKKDI